PADGGAIDRIRERLCTDGSDDLIVEVTQALVEVAGDDADTFALHGDDSVQLAAAQTLSASLQAPVRFACFDRRLANAARVLGMKPAFEANAGV
ncbi:VapC toxin family PIN domain ribonuclease, partial [Lamprobacter modestohalophilus]|nr:VapC toxin family PIN domain ribonuclease [Lamprobacter modestohalophilus]